MRFPNRPSRLGRPSKLERSQATSDIYGRSPATDGRRAAAMPAAATSSVGKEAGVRAIPHGVLARSGGHRRPRTTGWSGAVGSIVKLRNFRAGIEAAISCLKRAYALARCNWKGLAHFKASTSGPRWWPTTCRSDRTPQAGIARLTDRARYSDRAMRPALHHCPDLVPDADGNHHLLSCRENPVT